jgi:hypothetical protein
MRFLPQLIKFFLRRFVKIFGNILSASSQGTTEPVKPRFDEKMSNEKS